MTPVFVVIGATVLIIVLVLVSSNSGGGGKDSAGDNTNVQQPAKQAAQPKAAPSSVSLSSAKGGSAPKEPAPPLTKEMLDQVNGMLAEAKALFDEGYKMRQLDQKVSEANAKLDQAAAKMEEISKFLETPLAWQEKAEMDDWAQPAEYVTLGQMYKKISTLENKIRKLGGKR